ncbi:MAG: SUMF1/EgtB/PvdO family nonheme iron enzyme, partial [Acidobacteriota bacterium]
DMVGNAWEWTASDFIAYPGGQLPPGEVEGELKVIRGGCWQSLSDKATTAFRVGWPARGFKQYDNTSFRCVKNAPASAN